MSVSFLKSPFLAHLVSLLLFSSSPFSPFLALLPSILLALSELESLHFEVWRVDSVFYCAAV